MIENIVEYLWPTIAGICVGEIIIRVLRLDRDDSWL